MNLKDKSAAESLAVRYHAYQSANDALSISVWGKLLLQAQDETGVVLCKPENVEQHIAASAGYLGN